MVVHGIYDSAEPSFIDLVGLDGEGTSGFLRAGARSLASSDKHPDAATAIARKVLASIGAILREVGQTPDGDSISTQLGVVVGV